MTDTSEKSVERLADRFDKGAPWNGDLKHEAADMIRALVAERDALRAEDKRAKRSIAFWQSCAAKNEKRLEIAEAERDALRAQLAEAQARPVTVGEAAEPSNCMVMASQWGSSKCPECGTDFAAALRALAEGERANNPAALDPNLT